MSSITELEIPMGGPVKGEAATLDEKREVEYPQIKNWDDIPDLDPTILRGIFSYGFEAPSPIQQQTIIPFMQGRDVVAQAQSGTGKTGAFVVGALTRINIEDNFTQVIILSPTKELCSQTTKVVHELGSSMSGLRVKAMYGGIPITYDMQTPQIVCGCPGKIYDMLKKGAIQGSRVKTIILDEADALLSTKRGATSSSGGFKDQVADIFKLLSPDVQVGLFTATVPAYMEHLIIEIMRDPVIIKVVPEKLTLDGIKQYYLFVYSDMDKVACLRDIYNKSAVSQSIIYCNSVDRVVHLYNDLHKEDFPVCCIHSNMEKHIRDGAFADFVSGKYRILISSDVTARGIDVQQVSLVINFDIPDSKYTYLHRIGRGGRWGRKGVGINFVTHRDSDRMRDIEAYYKCQIDELPSTFSM